MVRVIASGAWKLAFCDGVTFTSMPSCSSHDEMPRDPLANLIPHGAADRRGQLLGDAVRGADGRNAPRLRDADQAAALREGRRPVPRLEQELRDLQQPIVCRVSCEAPLTFLCMSQTAAQAGQEGSKISAPAVFKLGDVQSLRARSGIRRCAPMCSAG